MSATTYTLPEDVVFGGGPGPSCPTVDDSLSGHSDESFSVALAFSHVLDDWVIVNGYTGEVYAQGDPAQLAPWLAKFASCLQDSVNQTRDEGK